MDAFDKINAAEVAHLNRGADVEPSLLKSYELLLTRWESGQRDRETALRLAFLVWFSWAEPIFLTGLPERPLPLLRDLFVALDVDETEDEEISFVLHVMMEVNGDFLSTLNRELGELVERNKSRLDRRYVLNPEIFEGRGVYGNYFAGQVTSQSKYCAEGDPQVVAVRKYDA